MVSRFRHQRGEPRVLVVEGLEGPLRPTPLHPFWCENQPTWIPAHELEPGDLLRTAAGRPGQVFIPMHYADANRLTLGIFDPHSHQPAYKGCAVRVVKDEF